MKKKTNIWWLIIAAFAMVLSGCNLEVNTDNDDDFTSTKGKALTSIQIMPVSITTLGASDLRLAVGNIQKLIAIGTYDDGTTVDITSGVIWRSAGINVSVSIGGQVTAIAEGYAVITAALGDISSNSLDITVTSAILSEIQVTSTGSSTMGISHFGLAKGNTQQLIATGMYSDGTTADITERVNWRSSDANATVSNRGLVTGVEIGFASITATLEGLESNTIDFTVSAAKLVSIQLMPESFMTRGSSELSLAKGNTLQLVAIGRYSDDTTADITDNVMWRSNDYKAKVSANGLVTGVTEGINHITVTKGYVTSNTLAITISSARLTGIRVSPATVRVFKGGTQQLVATGIYSDDTTADITDSVNWSVSNRDTVTVSTDGMVRGVQLGHVRITATREDVEANSVPVEVGAAILTEIQITRGSDTALRLAKGTSQQLGATGIYSDGTTTEDITNLVAWHSSDTHIATVSSGLVTGIGEGHARISATLDSIFSNKVYTSITPAVLTGIQVSPERVSLAKGTSQQLEAIGTYSDGTTSNIANHVSWSSVNTDIVTVSNRGLAKGIGLGETSITAQQDGFISNEVTVDSTDAELVRIQVKPATLSATTSYNGPLLKALVAKNISEQLKATGIYSDDTEINLTGSVVWSSEDHNIVTVSPSGEVEGVDVGDTTVEARQDGIISNGLDIEVVTIGICGGIVDDTDKTSAAGQCLKVTSDGRGSWFTATPNLTVMDAFGYTRGRGDSENSRTYAETSIESGDSGPADVEFALFDQLGGSEGAVNGQYDRWCRDLASMNYAGRNNWRRATLVELNGLLTDKGESLWDGFGWPGSYFYSSSELNGAINEYLILNLHLRGKVVSLSQARSSHYASCVSTAL